MIDFPSSPSTGQIFTSGSASWKWDGTKWVPNSGDYATVAQAKSETLVIAVSDEITSLTAGAAKVTFRMPWAMALADARASLSTASSSGNPTIDSGEKTSTTAAAPKIISDANLADDAEITVDIDIAGTGAKGLKVTLIGTRA